MACVHYDFVADCRYVPAFHINFNVSIQPNAYIRGNLFKSFICKTIKKKTKKENKV